MNRQLYSQSGRRQLLLNQNIVRTALEVLGAIVYLVALLKLEIYAQYFVFVVFGVLFCCCSLLRWGWNLFWLMRLEWRCSALLNGAYRLASLQREDLSFEERIPSIIKVNLKLIYSTLFFLAWPIVLLPWIPSQPSSDPERWELLLLGGWGTAFVIFAFFVSWQSTIKITERGLKKNVLKASKTTEWSNANLFICYRLPNLIGKPQVIYYELSSQTSRITWMWVVNGRSVFVPWRPAIPDEQYQRQMQALTALVQEKTGLPLYDLSEPWLKRKQDGIPKE